MRIQLLHPPTLVSPANLQTPRPAPPLGLAYVAAALSEAGHECVVLDAIAEAADRRTPAGDVQRLGLTDDEIVACIDPEARAVAVTNMFSFNWPLVRGLLHAIRAARPDLIVVCGGEHFSALPEFCMRAAPIDYVVMGEGEEVAVALFAGLERDGFDPATVPGLCWRRGDEIVRNQRADRTRALDDIPRPAWDLFDLDRYNAHGLVGGLAFGRTAPILATRGCPYQCTYCSSVEMWTTRWYTRDPVAVVDEIEWLHRRWGVTNFPFQDLTMIVKKEWIVRFCNELIRRGLDVSWQLPSGTRCEVVDREVAPLLFRSGCRWLCYAPESGSERTRDLIKKRMKLSSLLDAVDESVRAGLALAAFFVIGFPHDTEDDLRATARVVRTLARRGVEDIAVNFFFPIPSTELFRGLEAKERITTSDQHLMAPLFGHYPVLHESRNFSEALDARTLTRWKYRIVATFYLTSWFWHPTRVARVAWHIARGRETSALEKFLGESVRRLVRAARAPFRRRPADGRPTDARSRAGAAALHGARG